MNQLERYVEIQIFMQWFKVKYLLELLLPELFGLNNFIISKKNSNEKKVPT